MAIAREAWRNALNVQLVKSLVRFFPREFVPKPNLRTNCRTTGTRSLTSALSAKWMQLKLFKLCSSKGQICRKQAKFFDKTSLRQKFAAHRCCHNMLSYLLDIDYNFF